MKPVVIPIGMDLQGMYDNALTMERCFGQMAETLSMNPSVCTHQYTAKGEVDGETVQCAGCGHLVPSWMVME